MILKMKTYSEIHQDFLKILVLRKTNVEGFENINI